LYTKLTNTTIVRDKFLISKAKVINSIPNILTLELFLSFTWLSPLQTKCKKKKKLENSENKRREKRDGKDKVKKKKQTKREKCRTFLKQHKRK
jgi:hypothetical protein